jgi:hypothetical protein
MAKQLRRSMAEYKKDVQLARLRRRATEKANELFIREHGFENMRRVQECLMGGVVKTPNIEWNVAVPMQSITIPDV